MYTRIVLSSLLLSACAVDTPDTTTTEAEVLGSVRYSNCTADQVTFLESARSWGRITSTTRAFEQCLEQASTVSTNVVGGFWFGPYRQCNGDPYHGAAIAEQVRRALEAARSPNALDVSCTGGSGNASAALGRYDDTDAESLAFSPFLATLMSVERHQGLSQSAEITWHEVMHQHGYTHGANDQENAPAACGYAGDATWHFQTNTMPYITGWCVKAVLDRSRDACGAVESCGPGQLRLVDDFGSGACSCVADPEAISTRAANAYTHVTTTANTSGSMTTLDHPLLNGRATAIVQFTHVYAPAGTGGAYNPARAHAWYNYSTGRWVIQNIGSAAMPLDTGFFVRVGRGAVHRTTSANISGHWTWIDHPLANGNPGALVTVTRTPYAGASSGAVNDHPIGVWYDPGAQRWSIFNQDYVAMPVNTAFTVDVETAAHRGLDFVHRTDTTNRSGHMTRLTSPFLDGNPSARFLATLDYRRGSVFDTNEFGVWYDGARWWVYHENRAAMPNGLAFHIEILKDEVQRWVPVLERDALKDTGIDIGPGDRIRVSAAGMLQPFFGTWASDASGGAIAPSPPFPLAAPRYSLIGRYGSDPLFPIGRDAWLAAPAAWRRLNLRTNDDVVGNGSGGFMAEVRVFR